MLTFYTKKPCVQCNATQRWLDQRGLVENEHYTKIDVTHDPKTLDTLREMGHIQAPVLAVDDDNHWAGFDPVKLQEWHASL